MICLGNLNVIGSSSVSNIGLAVSGGVSLSINSNIQSETGLTVFSGDIYYLAVYMQFHICVLVGGLYVEGQMSITKSLQVAGSVTVTGNTKIIAGSYIGVFISIR